MAHLNEAMVAFATRFLILPVGFAHSSFARILAEPEGTIFRKGMIGVLPMDSTTFVAIPRVPEERD